MISPSPTSNVRSIYIAFGLMIVLIAGVAWGYISSTRSDSDDSDQSSISAQALTIQNLCSTISTSALRLFECQDISVTQPWYVIDDPEHDSRVRYDETGATSIDCTDNLTAVDACTLELCRNITAQCDTSNPLRTYTPITLAELYSGTVDYGEYALVAQSDSIVRCESCSPDSQLDCSQCVGSYLIVSNAIASQSEGLNRFALLIPDGQLDEIKTGVVYNFLIEVVGPMPKVATLIESQSLHVTLRDAIEQ